LEYSNIPESFKGLPIALISAAFVSLAFFGFQGLLVYKSVFQIIKRGCLNMVFDVLIPTAICLEE